MITVWYIYLIFPHIHYSSLFSYVQADTYNCLIGTNQVELTHEIGKVRGANVQVMNQTHYK